MSDSLEHRGGHRLWGKFESYENTTQEPTRRRQFDANAILLRAGKILQKVGLDKITGYFPRQK